MIRSNLSATGTHVGRFALPGEVTMRRKYGNSGGNSAAILGNSDLQTAIHSRGEGSKREESGNSRPGNCAFIKLEKEGKGLERRRRGEGVRATAAASRILPGLPVLEFYLCTLAPSVPWWGGPSPWWGGPSSISSRDVASRISPLACILESGRALRTCLVQTGAKSSPDSG